MRKAIAVGSLLLLAAFVVACSGRVGVTTPSGTTTSGGTPLDSTTPREKLLEQDLGVLDDVVATLANAKNQNDLNAAKPKLTELFQKHKDIKEDAKKLGEPTPQEKGEMARKYGDRVKTAKGKLNEEMRKVLQLGGGGDLYRQLVEFNQDF